MFASKRAISTDGSRDRVSNRPRPDMGRAGTGALAMQRKGEITMEEHRPAALKQADSELLFVVACGFGLMVHSALAQGANVNAYDTEGRTAIMLATLRAAGERGR